MRGDDLEKVLALRLGELFESFRSTKPRVKAAIRPSCWQNDRCPPPVRLTARVPASSMPATSVKPRDQRSRSNSRRFAWPVFIELPCPLAFALPCSNEQIAAGSEPKKAEISKHSGAS